MGEEPFIFPLLSEDKTDISRETYGEEIFLSGKIKSIIFKGNELGHEPHQGDQENS
jgi:hypothetical protein